MKCSTCGESHAVTIAQKVTVFRKTYTWVSCVACWRMENR